MGAHGHPHLVQLSTCCLLQNGFIKLIWEPFSFNASFFTSSKAVKAYTLCQGSQASIMKQAQEKTTLKKVKIVSWSSNNYCASLTNFSSNIREFEMVRDAPVYINKEREMQIVHVKQFIMHD